MVRKPQGQKQCYQGAPAPPSSSGRFTRIDINAPSVPHAVISSLESLSIAPNPVASKSIVQMKLPPRPSFGTQGKEITIIANHFKLNVNLNGEFYHYDVSMALQGEKFTNEGLNKTCSRFIMKALLDKIKKEHPQIVAVNDSRKNIFTSAKFPFQEKLYQELVMPDQQKPRFYHALVKESSPVAVGLAQLNAFFQGKLNYTPYDALQALDIAMRHTASYRFVSVGKSLYADKGAKDIGEGAQVWFGYFQSVRATQNHLVVNLDLAATAFVKAMSCLDYLVETLDERTPALPKSLQKHQISLVSKAFKGVKVQPTHRPNAIRSYRVNGLSSVSAQDLFFEDDTGKKTSVAAYFAKTYGPLKYPGLPCLHVGAQNKKNYLPLEVCNIIAGQKSPRKVTDKQVANMIRFTCTKPDDRKRRIEQKLREAEFDRDPLMKAFGMQVNPTMVTTKARVLPEPEMGYAAGSERPRDGAWNMRNKTFYQANKLTSWAIISACDPRRCGADQIKNFFTKVIKQMKELGMQIPQQLPPIVEKKQRYDKVRDLFYEAMEKAQGMFKAPPQIIWLINPMVDAATYGELKRVSDTECGIPSQCMLAKHIDKANPQYIANILLKVNTKLGGMNTIVRQHLPQVSTKPTIVFGADVTHPGPMERSRPSIAALVASMDRNCVKHAASMRTQGHRVEQIVELEHMAKDLLIQFFKETRVKPASIVFYRDGVSEGQFQMILNFEVTALRAACASLEKGYNPPITFIIVQKRHNTRFFAMDPKDTDRSGNVKAGTVVDRGICHPFEYDFYLMSHAGLQGTSRPAHYHVVMDENAFTPDELQTLTYRLCYTFARCTRSVSIVPSAYYSHLVAYRARFFTPHGDSDTASSVSGSGKPTETDLRISKVHQNLKSVMFFV